MLKLMSKPAAIDTRLGEGNSMFEGSFLPYLHDCGRADGPRREGECDYTGRLLQVRGGGDIDIVSVVTGERVYQYNLCLE